MNVLPRVEVPYGFCHCGCGEQTSLARDTNRRRGYAKGEPLAFIHGHNSRLYRPVIEEKILEEDRGYRSLCWVWQGIKSQRGYGYVSMDGRTQMVHKVLWEKEHGPIPSGLELDHLCRVKACVNPAHLEPVTHRENTRRAWPTSRPEFREKVRQMWQSGGYSMRAIGREMGVKHDTISRLLKEERLV